MVASVEDQAPSKLLDFEERQRLKDLEDRLIDIMLILDSTIDTISTLRKKYRDYRYLDANSDQVDDNDLIETHLKEKEHDATTDRRKVAALRNKVQGTMAIVRDLNILVSIPN